MGRHVQTLEAAGQGAVDDRALRRTLIERLRRVVPFDAFVWVVTDPATGVGASPLADVPDGVSLPDLIRDRYLADEGRWTSLGPGQVGGLPSDARDPWRTALEQHNMADVATLAQVDTHGCWGFLDLWRATSFTGPEHTRLVEVTPTLTRLLRTCLAQSFSQLPAYDDVAGPAVVVLAPSLAVRQQTATSDRALRALLPTPGDRAPIPAAVWNVAAQLVAREAGVSQAQPRARVHVGAGRWVCLEAARLGADPTRDIAVTITRASVGDLVDLFARLHALTAREREVLEAVVAGADTRAIAGELFVSEFTVQDHLKAIFTRTGVRSRRELLARVRGS